MKNKVSVLDKLRSILTASQKRGVIFLFLGLVFCAVIDTVAVGLMMPFMYAVIDPSSVAQNSWWQLAYRLFGAASNTDLLVKLALLLAAIYMLRGVFKFFVQWIQARLLAKYRVVFSMQLFSYVMCKPYSYHLHNSTSDTLRLLTADVNNTFSLVGIYLTLSSSVCVSFGILSLLFSIDPLLTISAIVLLGGFLLLSNYAVKRLIASNAQKNFRANSQMIKWIQQAMGGLKDILVKRRAQFFVKNYADNADDAARANGNYVALDAAPKFVTETACMIAIFVYMAVLIGKGEAFSSTLPLFATFAVAAVRLIPVLGQIVGAVNASVFYRPSLDVIYDMITSSRIDVQELMQRQVDGGTEERKTKTATPPLTYGVEVRDLTFRFEDAEQPLFSQLSIRIPAGKSVAFVGVTGSGKTTLADIILGLQKPASGQVLADGRDISENGDWWSDMIGYIPQFIYLCDDTIRANVAFGCKGEDIDDARVWQCLEDAQMKEFVESMPDTIHAMTGENGIRLSGGQRQRIGIARALYTNPQFLVMDEATSALDNDTEQAIIESINRLAGQKTLLIIAHRLTTIRDCDLIYRVENGTATLEKGRL